jgi:hypothetical protein
MLQHQRGHASESNSAPHAGKPWPSGSYSAIAESLPRHWPKSRVDVKEDVPGFIAA